MSFLHIGFIVLKHSARPLLELALHRYAGYLIKTAKGYLVYQIDALCKEGKVVPDSYAARVQGYYTLEQVAEKLATSNSDLAKDIVKFTISLHEEDDFVILDKVANDQITDKLTADLTTDLNHSNEMP